MIESIVLLLLAMVYTYMLDDSEKEPGFTILETTIVIREGVMSVVVTFESVIYVMLVVKFP